VTTLDHSAAAIKILAMLCLCWAAWPLRLSRYSVVLACILVLVGCTPMQRKAAAGAGAIIAVGMIKAKDADRGTIAIPQGPDCINRPEVCR
jgi:hypothetical protein